MAFNKRLLPFLFLSLLPSVSVAGSVNLYGAPYVNYDPPSTARLTSTAVSNFGRPVVVNEVRQFSFNGDYTEVFTIHAMDNQKWTDFRAKTMCFTPGGSYQIASNTLIKWKNNLQASNTYAQDWTPWVRITTTGQRSIHVLVKPDVIGTLQGHNSHTCSLFLESSKYGAAEVYKLDITYSTTTPEVLWAPSNVSVDASSDGSWVSEDLTLQLDYPEMGRIELHPSDWMKVEFTHAGAPGGKYELGPTDPLELSFIHPAGHVETAGYERYSLKVRFSGTTNEPKTYTVRLVMTIP